MIMTKTIAANTNILHNLESNSSFISDSFYKWKFPLHADILYILTRVYAHMDFGGHNSKITKYDYTCLRALCNYIWLSKNSKDGANALEINEKYCVRITKNQGCSNQHNHQPFFSLICNAPCTIPYS